MLDANNYDWERDRHIDELDRGETTTSGLLHQHLPTSKVVQAFNHIMAKAPRTLSGAPIRPRERRPCRGDHLVTG